MLLLIVLVAQAAGAATISYSSSIPLSTTNWEKQISLPQFNPALGTLESVEIRLAAYVEGMAFFENMDAEPTEVTTELSAQISLHDSALTAVAFPIHTVVDSVEAFDGDVDFGGTSGKMYAGLAADDSAADQTTDPSRLSQYTGTGTIDFTAQATGKSRVVGPGNLAAGFQTKAKADVTVIYTYSDIPGAIGDLVWIDSDADGIYEPAIGELGVNGVRVDLYDSEGNLVATTYTTNHPNTGEPGWYLFDGLTAGPYEVVVAAANFDRCGKLYGFAQTYDYDLILDNQTYYGLGSGETFLGADFGYRPRTQPGTGTPGYWKNHPQAWPVESITIGGVTYTKSQAIEVIKGSGGDKSNTLFSSLVCAMLNVGLGNNSACINDTLYAAQNWMATYGPAGSKVKANSPAWKAGEPLHTTLDKYNNGQLCAPHRD